MHTQPTVSEAQNAKFANWFMNVSARVAEINKNYGVYLNLKVGSVDGVMIVDVTIPSYGPSGYTDEERMSPLVDEYKFTIINEAIDRFELHMEKQRKMMVTMRETIGAMTSEALEAVCMYLTGTSEEPLVRRERVLYEMALAEQVRRKTK